MGHLADTTIAVTKMELYAILVGFVVVSALQLWAMVEAVARKRWGWLAGIWFGFPIGMVAWLVYGRRDDRTSRRL